MKRCPYCDENDLQSPDEETRHVERSHPERCLWLPAERIAQLRAAQRRMPRIPVHPGR